MRAVGGFDEHCIARPNELRQLGEQLGAILKIDAGLPRAFGNVLCQFALRDQKINAVTRGIFADRAVERRGVFPHFQHVAEDTHTPSAKRGERVDRRTVGRWIGVVAVVYKRAISGFDDTGAAADRFIPGKAARDLLV